MTDTKTDYAEATARDVTDIKAIAGRWRRDPHRPQVTDDLFRAVCEALDQGRCPQAVQYALNDLVFVKRGALTPADPVGTFWGTVRNQEDRIRNWAVGRGHVAPRLVEPPGGRPLTNELQQKARRTALEEANYAVGVEVANGAPLPSSSEAYDQQVLQRAHVFEAYITGGLFAAQDRARQAVQS